MFLCCSSPKSSSPPSEQRFIRPRAHLTQGKRYAATEFTGAGSSSREGFAKSGQRIIIVAGVPLGTPGATNMRIAFVGSEASED
jgi:hypothetical protein